MRRLALILLVLVSTACVSYHTTNTVIEGKPYICRIRWDRNDDRHTSLRCVPGQLP